MEQSFNNIGYEIVYKNGKYDISLIAFPGNNLSSLIMDKFFPPGGSNYKGIKSWEYLDNYPNKKENTDNILFYDLEGGYGINQLLEGLKNVKTSFDDDISNIPGYYTMLNCPREDLIDSEETRSRDYTMIPYSWQNEILIACSWKDITYIYDIHLTQEEYYSTPEVIEVLEKWKEALERWNNLEERQKMIEEYEKEHGKEK